MSEREDLITTLQISKDLVLIIDSLQEFDIMELAPEMIDSVNKLKEIIEKYGLNKTG